MGAPAISILPDQTAHVEIMRAVVEDMCNLPMVLKGGTALLLCYGLDRFSEDLDFDAPKRFNITGRIERVLSSMVDEFTIKTVKDTETVQRLKIHYRKQTFARLLKVETSFRDTPNPADIIVLDGIRTYTASALIDQKIGALIGRTKARDLYDVVFLAKSRWNEFSPQAKQTLRAMTQDLNGLASRFRLAFEDDSILNTEHLDGLILELAESVQGH